MRNLYITAVCMFLAVATNAQQKRYTEKDYARNPIWIEMIDDTLSNFFETEKAFNTYFKHNDLPASEHDMIGEYAERKKTPTKRRQKEIEQESYLRRQVKKYHRWHEKMLPYVQPDGRILTPTERLAIWQQIKDENNKK